MTTGTITAIATRRRPSWSRGTAAATERPNRSPGVHAPAFVHHSILVRTELVLDSKTPLCHSSLALPSFPLQLWRLVSLVRLIHMLVIQYQYDSMTFRF